MDFLPTTYYYDAPRCHWVACYAREIAAQVNIMLPHDVLVEIVARARSKQPFPIALERFGVRHLFANAEGIFSRYPLSEQRDVLFDLRGSQLGYVRVLVARTFAFLAVIGDSLYASGDNNFGRLGTQGPRAK